MSIPAFGHLPAFYVDGSAIVSLVAMAIQVTTWTAHRTLAVLRDIRRYRRGE